MSKKSPEVTFAPATGAMNRFLRGESIHLSPYDLTEKGRKERGLTPPVSPGTRVAFLANLGSVLFYSNPPQDQEQGTVALIRTASGDMTLNNNRLFVRWDSGRFLPVQLEHVRQVPTLNVRNASMIRTSNLSNFVRVAGGDDLIHKSTRDLWTVMEQDGEYVIARLFAEDGNPIKV